MATMNVEIRDLSPAPLYFGQLAERLLWRLQEEVIGSRQRGSLSISAIARGCGVSRPTVGRYFRGTRIPRLDALDKILISQGLSVLDLLPAGNRETGSAARAHK